METSSGRQLRPETNCLMLRQGGKATASENGPWLESNWMRLGKPDKTSFVGGLGGGTMEYLGGGWEFEARPPLADS